MKLSGFYELEEIYNSSKSRVYRAKQDETGSEVIIKMLDEEFIGSRDALKLHHEYKITKLFRDYCRIEIIDGNLCIVMDDDGGISLDRIIRHKVLSPEEFLSVAIEIIKNIDLIHSKKVIHKDINPSNIIWNIYENSIKIIDFGISTELNEETTESRSFNNLEGTLNYISPEQTGRMNRNVDYRTDYYSYGITLYELLFGCTPFDFGEPIKIIHGHLAIEPVFDTDKVIIWGSETEKKSLDIIVRIISKLMSKSAEDRYQSATGIISDLNECLILLKNEDVSKEEFVLGQNDFSKKFKIPRKLFGREFEVEALLESYNYAYTGGKRLLLVSGYSGVGKTSLVYEMQKSIVGSGYFCDGKFDQFKKDVPYSAFISAVSKLIKQLLSESDLKISEFREEIKRAVGENGKIVVDLIPELEYLIGKQPEIATMGLDETKNRFNHTMQNFVQSLGKKGRPLILFLDDLQWADQSSLSLIELTMNSSRTEGLLLIGAYRDNEVGLNHPLTNTISNIEYNNQNILMEKDALFSEELRKIYVKPLERDHITQLICEATNRGFKDVQTLVDICFSTTEGNPFFLIQLLKAFNRDQIIILNSLKGYWQWDERDLINYDFRGDVIELLLKRFYEFDEVTRDILKLAACAGNEFDLSTLAIIYEKTMGDTAADLWRPMEEGIIAPKDDGYLYVDVQSASHDITARYKFTHDRLQQAAYAIIDEELKQKVHLSIGRLMLNEAMSDNKKSSIIIKFDGDLIAEKLFDIVNHFNIAIDEVIEIDEKNLVIALNLSAGAKAMNSNAYRLSYQYYQKAITLIGYESWDENYNLLLSAYLGALKAAYYCLDFEYVEEKALIVLKNTKNIMDEIPINQLLINLYTAKHELSKAVDIGLRLLEKFDVKIPIKVTVFEILKEYLKAKFMVRNKTTEELLNMGSSTDETASAIVSLLLAVSTASFLGRPDIFPIIALKLFQYSVKYGNFPSGLIYPTFGLLNIIISNDFETAYKFGELGIQLTKKDEYLEYRSQAILFHYAFIYHWKKPLKDTVEELFKGYELGIENGDFEYACWCVHVPCFHAFYCGYELNNLGSNMDKYLKMMHEMKHETVITFFSLTRQVIHNLVSEIEEPWMFKGKYFDEDINLNVERINEDKNTTASIYVWKIIFSVMFNRYDDAIKYLESIKEYEASLMGLSTYSVYIFYSTLACFKILPHVTRKEKEIYLKKINKNLKLIKRWSEISSVDNMSKYYLIKAELENYKGNVNEASRFYDKAIEALEEAGNPWEEAICYEHFGRFNIKSGNKSFGAHLILESIGLYRKWGATSKVKQLNNEFKIIGESFKLQKGTIRSLNTWNDSINESSQSYPLNVDVFTSVKMFQAISSEVKLQNLLEKTMELVIDNAGAERGILIIPEGDVWSKQGYVNDGKDIKVLSGEECFIKNDDGIRFTAENNQYATTIVSYVLRTSDAVVLEDASNSKQFENDEYLSSNLIKSVLCLPLLNKGEISGILYLENNMHKGVFTTKRVELLKMIATQAAISIENSKLYEMLETKVEERTNELNCLNKELELMAITDRLTGIYNRRKIDQIIESEYASSMENGKPLTVILFDIDKFKDINDNYGHFIGDDVLQHMAMLIKREIKRNDYFGRWGGEEFIVICPSTTSAEGEIIAERLRNMISKEKFPIPHQVTCSFGVASTSSTIDIGRCLRNVDDALYEAKNKGRNRVEVSSESGK